MNIEVIEQKENPLFKRSHIKFNVYHDNSPTPTRSSVRKELASEIKTSEDQLIIEKFTTLHGTQRASGIARVYETKEQLEDIEPEYLIDRNIKSIEKEMVSEDDEVIESDEESGEEQELDEKEVESEED